MAQNQPDRRLRATRIAPSPTPTAANPSAPSSRIESVLFAGPGAAQEGSEETTLTTESTEIPKASVAVTVKIERPGAVTFQLELRPDSTKSPGPVQPYSMGGMPPVVFAETPITAARGDWQVPEAFEVTCALTTSTGATAHVKSALAMRPILSETRTELSKRAETAGTQTKIEEFALLHPSGRPTQDQV